MTTALLHTHGRPTAAIRRELAEIAQQSQIKPRASAQFLRDSVAYSWRTFRNARAEGAPAAVLDLMREAFHADYWRWRIHKAEVAAYRPEPPKVHATRFERTTISWRTLLDYENRDSLSADDLAWLSRCEIDWTGAPASVRAVDYKAAAE